MPIQVFVADEQSDRPVDPGKVGELAERVLADRGVQGADRAIRGDVELTVLFVDEPAIASLNERWLGHEGPTDVLSFPLETGEDLTDAGTVGPPGSGRAATGPGSLPAATGPGWTPAATGAGSGSGDPVPLLLGDVVICPEVAYRNAPEHAGSYDDELALLLVHGILHLLGMDHVEDDEAEEMEALERELLSRYHRGRLS